MRTSQSYQDLHPATPNEDVDDLFQAQDNLARMQRFEIEHGGATSTPENTPSPPPRPNKAKKHEIASLSFVDAEEAEDSHKAASSPTIGSQSQVFPNIPQAERGVKKTSFQAKKHNNEEEEEDIDEDDDHVKYTSTSYQHSSSYSTVRNDNDDDIMFSPSRKSSTPSKSSSWLGYIMPSSWRQHKDHHAEEEEGDGRRKRNYSTPSSNTVYPRLIERSQDPSIPSQGNIFIRKRIRRSQWFALYGMDWFHTLVDAPTSRIIMILLSVYVLVILFFASMYYWVHCAYYCDLDFGNSFIAALDFSIETMATIGYGTKNIYFDNCVVMTVLLLSQICIRLIVDGVVVGVVYSRYSSSSNRASTLIFSDRLIIRRIRGKLYAMFQLCELRKRQLVEAHVRLYVVKKEVDYDAVLSSGSTPKLVPGSALYRQQRRQQLNRDDEDSHGKTWKDDEFIMTNKSHQRFGSGSVSPLPPSSRQSQSKKSSSTSVHNADKIRDTDPLLDRNQSNVDSPAPSSSIHAINSSKYTYLQTSSMRLSQPDDALGGMLLLMLPQLVVHELDATSPLMPPPYWIARTASRMHATKTKRSEPKGKALSKLSMYEEIRWHPPAYQPFIVPSSSPSSMKYPFHSNKYDVNALSNMNFPHVMKRSSDYVATMSSSSSRKYERGELIVEKETDEENNNHGNRNIDNSLEEDVMKTPTKHSNRNNGKNTSISSSTANSTSTYFTASAKHNPASSNSSTGFTATSSGLSRRKRRNQEGINTQDYHSPGMQRYAQEMSQKQQASHGTATYSRNGSAGASGRMRVWKEEEEEVVEKDNSGDESDSDDEEDDEKTLRQQPKWQVEEKEMIQRYLQDREVEIIAIVEGTDSTTGGSVQARHSYLVNEIIWDKRFEHCVYIDETDGYTMVDFEMFHTLVDAPLDAAYPGPIPSCI